jgi:hypothetical protein
MPDWPLAATLRQSGRSVGSGQNLSQSASNPVRHRVNYVIVDVVSNFLGELRGSGWHSFAWKCDRVLREA